MNAYLADLGPGAPVRSLKDVIAFNEREAREALPVFGQDLLLKAEDRGPSPTPRIAPRWRRTNGSPATRGSTSCLRR